MSNSGVIEHESRGVKYSLRFSYDAIDAIEKRFGENWTDRLNGLFTGVSIADMVFVVSLASGVTQKDIRKDSPPVIPMINALYSAWELAWKGEETVTEVAEEPEKKILASVIGLMRPKLTG